MSEFATTQGKSELVAELDKRAAALVPHFVAETMARAGNVLDAKVVATAHHWLDGNDQYEVRERSPQRVPAARPPLASSRLPAITYRTGTGPVSWRNLLITNLEMADLLNSLQSAGAPNTRDGVHLFVVPMPHERGGRLHQDASGRWRASSGYEQHPAYWVTWLGAAAMAAWFGARLPTRTEALAAAADAPEAHTCDYRFGDTTPVAEPHRARHQIHHLLGNLQIWCADGPATSDEPARRYLFGAAWNTPADPVSVRAERSRHLFGASRGVGIRLVTDEKTTTADELGAWELAQRFNSWIEKLAVPASLGERDRLLITSLAGPDLPGCS